MKAKVVSIFVLLLFVSTQCLTLAQVSQTNQAVLDAKNDVDMPLGWFAGSFLVSVGLGCLGGTVIVATSQVIPVPVPTHRFMGKSPEYVSAYTLTYKENTKRQRLIYTSLGCVGGSAVAAWIVINLNLYNY